MSNNEIRDQIKDAMGTVHKQEQPAFAEVWAAAESQHLRARRRYATFGGIAAAIAMVTVVAGLWSTEDAGITDEYLIADSLLNGTQWSAPSDALMPQHEIDLYREVPFPMESTNLDEGSLL
jgi:hypothetical protein